jgi:hypothetical protein
MGYPYKAFAPAARAARPRASLPMMKSFSDMPTV